MASSLSPCHSERPECGEPLIRAVVGAMLARRGGVEPPVAKDGLMRRWRWFLVAGLALAACEPQVIPPQPAAVSAMPSDGTPLPSPPVATQPSPSAVALPSPSPTPVPLPSPTPPRVPAPAIEGYVYHELTADDLKASPLPKLTTVDVVALSKTVDKPYYRAVKASPRFEFTDLPFEAEIEITAALENWTRGVVVVKTGTMATRSAITIPMRTQIYANVPVQ